MLFIHLTQPKSEIWNQHNHSPHFTYDNHNSYLNHNAIMVDYNIT